MFSRSIGDQFPSSETTLVPIRIDVDVDGYRYIDSFMWNMYDGTFRYAHCNVISLTCVFISSSYERDCTAESFAATLVRDLDLPELFHKPITTSIEAQVDKARRVPPWYDAVEGESLHPIFINLRINDTIFIDRFEWDLSNPSNSPEQFAQVLCDDLVLHAMRDGWARQGC